MIKKGRPDQKFLEDNGIRKWPIWEKGISKFDWEYDSTETCYILEGKAIVRPENGDSVEFGKGEMVVFPKGMKCEWEIISPIRKHYNFE